MRDEDSYHSEYYRDHREEIRENRRQRYANDPVYREARKEAARKRKKIVLEENRKERARLGLKPGARRTRVPMAPKAHVLEINGKDYLVEMQSAGQLANVLNRKTQTVRLWEKKGILPEALYRDSRKMRLYPAFQVKQLKDAYRKARIDAPKLVMSRISQTSFPEAAAEIWRKWPLGVDVDELTAM